MAERVASAADLKVQQATGADVREDSDIYIHVYMYIYVYIYTYM